MVKSAHLAPLFASERPFDGYELSPYSFYCRRGFDNVSLRKVIEFLRIARFCLQVQTYSFQSGEYHSSSIPSLLMNDCGIWMCIMQVLARVHRLAAYWRYCSATPSQETSRSQQLRSWSLRLYKLRAGRIEYYHRRRSTWFSVTQSSSALPLYIEIWFGRISTSEFTTTCVSGKPEAWGVKLIVAVARGCCEGSRSWGRVDSCSALFFWFCCSSSLCRAIRAA